MSCVHLTKTRAKQISLLTHAEKIAKLEKTFIKYRRKSDLFLPSPSFYAKVVTPEHVDSMAGEIFAWLGIKHRSLSVRVDTAQEELGIFLQDGDRAELVLGWRCLKDPYLCGGVLAHQIAHYLLISRAKYVLASDEDNEYLSDLAVIYGGLGILGMNGLAGNTATLGCMNPRNYAAEFLDFTRSHGMVTNTWQPYLLPSAERLLYIDELPLRSYQPYVRAAISTKASFRLTLTAVSILLLGFAGVCIYLFTLQPNAISGDIQYRLDDINTLRTQYNTCINEVNRRKDISSQSDTSTLHQLETDESRCTSLQNRYNQEIGEFNRQADNLR